VCIVVGDIGRISLGGNIVKTRSSDASDFASSRTSRSAFRTKWSEETKSPTISSRLVVGKNKYHVLYVEKDIMANIMQCVLMLCQFN
jgi:hypothetical protein